MTTALIIGGGSHVSSFNREDYDLLCVVNLGIKEFDTVDIWISGLIDIEQQRELAKDKHFKLLLRTNVEDKSFVHRYPIEFNDRVVYMDSSKYKVLRDRFRPKKPTTGVAGIWYLLDKCTTVYYTGFDSYRTPNRFYPNENHVAENHNFDKERDLLEVWKSQFNLIEL